MSSPPSLRYSHVFLDIEGTTTSIAFVKSVLFPFILSHLERHLEETYDEEQTQADIVALRAASEADQAASPPLPFPLIPSSSSSSRPSLIAAVAANVRAQMAVDRKSTALKQLQGHMWQAGYKNKSFTGHLYPDSAPAIKRWHGMGIKVFIYSSGSIEAQKLLFGYSDEGDLLPYLSGHFDTTIGMKQDSSSYSRILESTGCAGERALFCTDMLGEAKAAREAGMNAVILDRPGNGVITEEHTFPVVKSFDEIQMNE